MPKDECGGGGWRALVRHGVWGRPAKGIVPLFLFVTLSLLPFGMILPFQPALMEVLPHVDMCPNITHARNLSGLGGRISSYSFDVQAARSSFGGITGAVTGPFAGFLTDKWGRRPVIILASLLVLLPFFALAASCDNALYIPLSATVGECGLGMVRVASHAYVADVVPRERRTEAYGVLQVTCTVAIILGSPLGGYLEERWGESRSRDLFYACASASLLPLLFSALALPEPRKQGGEDDTGGAEAPHHPP
mmetsp:Transcript_35930/g.84106  ORF Transcript_35930/g.84106 Transcript_35930/m.84106 type:complete len:250 (-) Transcript_35930:21-770(-)